MTFIKTNRAETVEPVKKDDQKVSKVTDDKSLLAKLRASVKRG